MNDTTPHNWFYSLLRAFIFGLVKLYYPRLEVEGMEKIPQDKPVIFVANHPNGLLDPILIMIGMRREVAFLAMSTLFANPVGRFFLTSFSAMPIYRKKDDGKKGGPQGDAPERNEVTFQRCRDLLHKNGTMALFPEGITHSDPYLAKFHTGAARIALSTEDDSNWTDDLYIVPVGLWYENKSLFRTSTLLVVGEPFNLAEYRSAYTEDEYGTARIVTDRIKESLDAVVLQAENAELLRAIPMVASWISPQFDELPLYEQHAVTDELIDTYDYVNHKDPDRLEAFSNEARRYASALYTLGIEDPWELELPKATYGRPRRLLTFLIVSLPFAFLGALISVIPYRSVKPVAEWFVGDDNISILSTVKLIGGAIFMVIGWLLAALAVGFSFGAGWGWFLFLVAPALGYCTLVWGEIWTEWWTLVSYRWLRLSQKELVNALTTQREKLAGEVLDVMHNYQHADSVSQAKNL